MEFKVIVDDDVKEIARQAVEALKRVDKSIQHLSNCLQQRKNGASPASREEFVDFLKGRPVDLEDGHMRVVMTKEQFRRWYDQEQGKHLTEFGERKPYSPG